MKKTSVSSIKREQKKSFLLRELSALIHHVAADEPRLSSLFVTRVELSRDGGICYIYFSTHTDEEAFKPGLEVLKLYKPSLRTALAKAMHSRYVPHLIFRYDKAKDKERHITGLLDKIIQEDENKDIPEPEDE